MLNKKENCITCGKEVGLLNKHPVIAGTLCSDCGKAIVAKFGLKTSNKMTKEELQKYIKENTEKAIKAGIEFKGTIDKKKSKVILDKNELRVTITTLFKQEVQKSSITKVVVSNYKPAGTVSSGFIEFRFPVRESIRTFKIKYHSNEQRQVDLIINEINSYIREVKVTCKQCGKVYFFNEADVKEAQLAASANLGKTLMGLGLFLPLAFLPDEKVQEFKRCRSCGSRNVDLEEQAHKKQDHV